MKVQYLTGIKLQDMNAYSIDEMVMIFERCTSFDDVEKICQVFHWLIRMGFQERSEALQVIALETIKKFS